ncbi:hypothetical protein G4B88_002052 [Cannabis sativa]|uniref:Uncharacterized protein n=1 Tax=Cannabis sativa TaxID=3483 RepID=A0A7J6HF56_CANSA|nr:hypothetical protein G4B88_002052 [Cannabis sativa]
MDLQTMLRLPFKILAQYDKLILSQAFQNMNQVGPHVFTAASIVLLESQKFISKMPVIDVNLSAPTGHLFKSFDYKFTKLTHQEMELTSSTNSFL